MATRDFCRPNPDELLRQIEAEEAQARRGRLKIFLGYASGVGKTMRMLDEARRRQERGQDVIIGAVQPKIEPDAAALLAQFETVPLRSGALDVEAILTRKPGVCFIDGLAYDNPYLSPFEEFQRYKTHPEIRKFFEGGKRISYGARAITAGGLQSLPKLTFPGGALLGCDAGFLNASRIKGSHAAIKTGMLAAEAAFEALGANRQHDELAAYPQAFEKSWLHEELHKARNFKPWMAKGLYLGTLMVGIDQVLFRGKAPWTLHHQHADHECLKPASAFSPIAYPKPDNKLTFDRLTSVFISNTNHGEDQPAHLTLKNPSVPVNVNLAKYAGPESRYCPAGVYEFVKTDEGQDRLQINAQNCVHCKTCDIKDPTQNIVWVTPEGGGGPNYPNM